MRQGYDKLNGGVALILYTYNYAGAHAIGVVAFCAKFQWLSHSVDRGKALLLSKFAQLNFNV